MGKYDIPIIIEMSNEPESSTPRRRNIAMIRVREARWRGG